MAAPTLVAVYGNPTPSATQVTTGISVTTPLTFTASWAAGDQLVMAVVRESGDATPSTPTATGLTFTAMASAGAVSANSAGLWFYQTTAAGAGASVTVSIALTGNSVHWDALLYRFSGTTGLGTPVSRVNSTATTDTSGTIAITTVQANSAIVYAAGDWAAISQTSPTYSTATAGAYTTEHNLNATGGYSSYGGVYPDSGAAGAKTVGLSSGSAMRLSYYAVEVKGSAAAATPIPAPPRVVSRVTRIRAARY